MGRRSAEGAVLYHKGPDRTELVVFFLNITQILLLLLYLLSLFCCACLDIYGALGGFDVVYTLLYVV